MMMVASTIGQGTGGIAYRRRQQQDRHRREQQQQNEKKYFVQHCHTAQTR